MPINIRDASSTSWFTKWSKVASFVALFGGSKLNVTVLIDLAKGDEQNVENLRRSHQLGKNSLIQVGDITSSDNADIEDLFDQGFYLRLVNGAYADKLNKKLTVKALAKGHPRMRSAASRWM